DTSHHQPGGLVSESNLAGDEVTTAYASPSPGTGECPSAASSCETVTSASGRSIVLGYDGANDSGRVTSSTDPLGRRWTYTYSSNRLASATDPLGNVTSYSYDTTNTSPLLVNDLVTVVRPNEQSGGPDAGSSESIAYDSA